MCGICGELRFDGGAPDPGVVGRMLPALARRGPDAAGTWHDDVVALGHRRLAIIDPTPNSAQPMYDGGCALVFNGAVYNYRELRAELCALGHRFRSDGDTEVVLRAYLAWGEDCVRHLDGMFAFAVWDVAARRLFCARDRFGIKPFYYSLDRHRFRFASNPQALLAAGGVDTGLDTEALQFQLRLHGVVPAPATLLRGVRKLEPAHGWVIGAQGAGTPRRYWALPAPGEAAPEASADWAGAVAEVLRDAVDRRHALADVPTGVLLSGGLDSSLLVALLARHGGGPLHTYSIGFGDQPEECGDEFAYSDQVAARFATRHRRIRIDDGELLARLPEAIDAMAEPMFAQDAIGFFLLAERVSREVKVVLSGQGADEVFGGYAWYPRMLAARGTPLQRFAGQYLDRDHAELERLLGPRYRGADRVEPFLEARLGTSSSGFLDAVLALDATTLVVDDPLRRVDNMTMAWGLEARVPYLDHHLVELAARCPAEQRIADGGKSLLKRVARGLLPDAVIDRPKGYFPVPTLRFVRGAALEFMRDVLDSRACRERGLFERRYVEQLLAAPLLHHTRLMASKLWQLVVIEAWLQRQVDGRGIA